MITTTTCSNCGAHVSVFRVKAHRRSPVCGEYRRSNEAAARLNAHAGDFVTVVQLITVKLQGLGVRTVRPAPNKTSRRLRSRRHRAPLRQGWRACFPRRAEGAR